jgi:osmotically-inducible protein OsmY
MTTAHIANTDKLTRNAVLEQLEWDSRVDASAIGVTAKDGAVTLTGFIGTYAGKLAAERAAKRVRGVRAVANDLDVRPMHARTDADIAADAVRALDLRESVPDNVQVVVHHAHVTLTGKVGFLYQSREAEKAVCHIKGVRGLFNHIEVAGGSVTRDVRHRINDALHRSADLDARRITVDVDDNVATLTGTVATWVQFEAAERAAANAPGITRVNNRIVVEPAAEAIDEMC